MKFDSNSFKSGVESESSSESSDTNLYSAKATDVEVEVQVLKNDIKNLRETFRRDKQSMEEAKNYFTYAAVTIFTLLLVCAAALYTVINDSLEFSRQTSSQYFQELLNIRKEIFVLPDSENKNK